MNTSCSLHWGGDMERSVRLALAALAVHGEYAMETRSGLFFSWRSNNEGQTKQCR
jgi:hypothetical protein